MSNLKERLKSLVKTLRQRAPITTKKSDILFLPSFFLHPPKTNFQSIFIAISLAEEKVGTFLCKTFVFLGPPQLYTQKQAVINYNQIQSYPLSIMKHTSTGNSTNNFYFKLWCLFPKFKKATTPDNNDSFFILTFYCPLGPNCLLVVELPFYKSTQTCHNSLTFWRGGVFYGKLHQ